MSEFKRENRYFVFKRNNLTASQIRKLHDLQNELRPDGNVNECVVVEQDWPCYESTWEMIEKVAKNEFSCPYKELAKAKERVEKLTSYVRIIATTPPSPQMGWSNEVVDPRKYREEYINEAWDYLEQLRKEQEQ